MSRSRALTSAGLALLMLGGCAMETGGGELADAAPAQAGHTAAVRNIMVNDIDPAANAIWNTQVEVMDDYGNFDPALMDEATWAALAEAANRLDTQSHYLAEAGNYVAAAPGTPLAQDAEGIDLAQIQAYIDANPQGFRAFSAAMAAHTGQLVDAVQARDAETVTTLVNDLQPLCKACHDVYWYPAE